MSENDSNKTPENDDQDRIEQYADKAQNTFVKTLDRVVDNLGLGGIDKRMIFAFVVTMVVLLFLFLGPIRMIFILLVACLVTLAVSGELVPLFKRLTGKNKTDDPIESSDSKSD